MPELKGAGRNQKKIYEFMVELYQKGQPIHPSFLFLQELCEGEPNPKHINVSKQAVEGLIKRNLIKIKAHGTYNSKIEFRRANVYIINEDLLPEFIKAERKEKNGQQELLDYVDSKHFDPETTEVIKDWIIATKANDSVLQLRYKLNELYEFCKGDWNLFRSKVSISLQRGWHNFIFEEDRQLMSKRESNKIREEHI